MAQLMSTVTVTTNAQGLLTDDSTLTVDGVTVPIPATLPSPIGNGTTRFAPYRIGVTLKSLGYRFASDYRSTARKGAGTYTFLAVPLH